MTVSTVLSIIEMSLVLIDQLLANHIRNEISQLKVDYETEISKPYGSIDDAVLYSVELRLNSIVQLYRSAIKPADATVIPGQA